MHHVEHMTYSICILQEKICPTDVPQCRVRKKKRGLGRNAKTRSDFVALDKLSFFPTSNGGMQNGSLVGIMYTLHTRFLHVWRRLACSVDAYWQNFFCIGAQEEVYWECVAGRVSLSLSLFFEKVKTHVFCCGIAAAAVVVVVLLLLLLLRVDQLARRWRREKKENCGNPTNIGIG